MRNKDNTEMKKSRSAERELAQRQDIYEWIQSIIAALMICVLLFVFGIRIIDVSGSSMNPTLFNGDKLIVSKLFYEPKVGDIVIFKTDSYDPDKALVKRIIATEGQVINIDFDNGIIYIDNEPIEEDYIKELTKNKLDFIGPKTVPENCVFVMGDNRNASTDSRDSRIGMVDKRLIIGKAYCVVYPLSNLGWVE